MARPKGSKNKCVHIWTEKEKEYFRQIVPGHRYIEIQALMLEFGLELTLNQIKGAIGRYKLNTGLNGQFKKGITPHNKGKKGECPKGSEKGWFKKGNKPWNNMPIGSERVSGDDYIYVKVADPNIWRPKQVLVWEEVNGQIPKGHTVIFADRDKRNFDIKNLILISRKQLIRLNENNLIKEDADLTRTGILVVDLYSKISERKRKI